MIFPRGNAWEGEPLLPLFEQVRCHSHGGQILRGRGVSEESGRHLPRQKVNALPVCSGGTTHLLDSTAAITAALSASVRANTKLRSLIA